MIGLKNGATLIKDLFKKNNLCIYSNNNIVSEKSLRNSIMLRILFICCLTFFVLICDEMLLFSEDRSMLIVYEGYICASFSIINSFYQIRIYTSNDLIYRVIGSIPR